jgi:glycogen debranching enzyme
MDAATQSHARTRHEHGNRRVVQHGRASTTSSIANAIVIKHDQLFFLCEPDGELPLDDSHGLGLYYHDCRYLNGYELRLGGVRTDRLASTAAAGFRATFELTNPDVNTDSGLLLEKERIAIHWERTLDANRCELHERIELTSYSVERVDVPVTIRLRSQFESLFEVRGAEPKDRGTLHDPCWKGGALEFAYDGADGVHRSLTAIFDPAPLRTRGTTAVFSLSIEPQESATITVRLRVRESRADTAAPKRNSSVEPRQSAAVGQSSDDWVAGATRVHSDNAQVNRVLDRSLRDLHVLRTTLHGRQYFAAGVPWYVTLFGRDSIITAIEAMALLPDPAEDTVRLLASYQGTRDDKWRDEEPGKIMHELRVGEMARLNEIPQTPYYGSVDATPLFLILLARHASWTGRLDLFESVRSHVDAALNWIDSSIARGGSGYLAYATTSSKGLANQGWKDSGDSVVNQDGSLAVPPIALVEVQGYVYAAWRGIAELYRRAGDTDTAERLTRNAADLRQRFERDFWVEALDTYAIALQKDNQPAAVISSNPGQALWSGVAAPDRASKVIATLMTDDMFSGWGIRTLSARERRYNPIGYHDGTVWPHDNAIAVAGMCQYGHADAALRIMGGILDAASHFAHDRLPEVFAGFDRRSHGVPVHYPVACHPQAWAAGAVPFMIESILGLRPDAFNRRLHVSHPVLPPRVRELSIERLRVGDATARLDFGRDAQGRVGVRDVKVNGHLDVIVE